MLANSPPALSNDWLDALLQQPTLEQWVNILESASMLNADGLARLLDQATHLARSEPSRARQLAQVCAAVASNANAPTIAPRAMYLRAQTHAISGEFDIALDHIRSARSAYQAIGEPLEALRTNIGLMHVLNELGRHQEALEAGQNVLSALPDDGTATPQALLLRALAFQNRGVCFETIGRYEAALLEYDAAEAHFATLDMTDRIGDISNNRGIVLTHLGRISEALAAYGRAMQIWSESGLNLLQAQTLSNIGDAYLAQGQYTRSLQAFEQARQLFEQLDALANKRILLRKLADAYLALNLYPEALALYREASELLRATGMADHQARALWGYGAALIAQQRYVEAAPALEEAAQLFSAADNTPMLSSVLLEQAALYRARGDGDLALRTAQDALQLVAGDRWPVQYIYACLRLSDLLLPDTSAAESHLLDAERTAAALNLPTVKYRLLSRLGHLRRVQNRSAEAKAYLDAAAAQIELLRGDLAQEAMRTSFLQDKTAVYTDLLQLALERGVDGDILHAFGLAERAKSRTLVDLLSGIIIPDRSTADPEVMGRLQSLRADLSATYNQFLAGPGATPAVPLPDLQARASRLEEEISLLQLRAADPLAAFDHLASPLSLGQLHDRLPEDLVIIAYHTLDDEVIAFIYWQGVVEVVRGLSKAERIRRLLQRFNTQLDRFRAGHDFVQRNQVALQKSIQNVLGELYAEVFAPLEGRLAAFAQPGVPLKVAVVPHSVLHHVPFHALYDGSHYLIDRFELSFAPSATVLALRQQPRWGSPRSGLVVGTSDDLIPLARQEVGLVAEQMAATGVQATLLVDEQASLASVNQAAPACDLLHIACHGLFRADNPMFSALKLHDGWLTAADVLQLDLNNALVTLSACESGRSTVLLSDEVIGLPRAFLAAGAAAVVVSLWLVQDATTMKLMAGWYANLREGLSPAAALRSAQLAVKAEHPHPYFWAPFVLTGQR